jgi:hypothetical protein
MARLMKRQTDKQMCTGISGLDLQRESERVAADGA